MLDQPVHVDVAARRARQRRANRDSGSVSLLLAVALVLAALVGYGVARVGGAAARSAAAQAAADASALAGAEDGRPGAERVAAANGSVLTGFVQDGLDVEVTVTRSGHTAVARARWQPRSYAVEPGSTGSSISSTSLVTRSLGGWAQSSSLRR